MLCNKYKQNRAELHPFTVMNIRPLVRREDGQSIIETALTMPAFLAVLAMVLYFGTVLFDFVSLSQATQVGLRQLVISRGQTSDPCATIVSAVTNSTSAMNDAKITYNLMLNNASYSGTSCTAAAANMIVGVNAQLKLSYAGITTVSTQEQDRIQ